jgi:alkylhydroperoxidase family enzyme
MTSRRFLALGAAALLASGAFVAAAQTAKLPGDLDPQSRARLPYLQRKDVTSEADQKIFETLPGLGKDGVLGGPLAFAAYNPGVAKALFDLHNAAVAGSLTPRVRELAIMVACRETNYGLEWNGHRATAIKVGVDEKLLDVILNNRDLTGVADADATVIRFGRQMYRDKKIDSATFAKAVEALGRRGAMDLVAVMNTYAVSGFYAIAVDEHMAPGRIDLEPIRSH